MGHGDRAWRLTREADARAALVEYTAAWCLNCRVLEQTVYADPRVAQALREGRIIAFRANLTRPHPADTPAATAALRDSSTVAAARWVRDADGTVVVLQLAPHWNVYASPAPLSYLIPVTISALRGGSPLPLAPAYPAGRDICLRLQHKTVRVYENGTRIALPGLHLTPGVQLRVHLQACDDSGTFLPPATVIARPAA